MTITRTEQSLVKDLIILIKLHTYCTAHGTWDMVKMAQYNAHKKAFTSRYLKYEENIIELEASLKGQYTALLVELKQEHEALASEYEACLEELLNLNDALPKEANLYKLKKMQFVRDYIDCEDDLEIVQGIISQTYPALCRELKFELQRKLHRSTVKFSENVVDNEEAPKNSQYLHLAVELQKQYVQLRSLLDAYFIDPAQTIMSSAWQEFCKQYSQRLLNGKYHPVIHEYIASKFTSDEAEKQFTSAVNALQAEATIHLTTRPHLYSPVNESKYEPHQKASPKSAKLA